MNSSNYRFSLDIQLYQSQVSLPILLNDTARTLYISLTDGGVPYAIADGCRAVFVAKKPNGGSLTNDCIIENESIIKYEFTAHTADVSGKHDCEIRLYGLDGRLITSPRFVMVVDGRVAYDDEVISQSESTTIDGIIIAEMARVEAEKKREEAAGKLPSLVEEAEELVEELRNVTGDLPDQLPSVTTADNGKFLRVVNGKWQKDELLTYNGETEDVT